MNTLTSLNEATSMANNMGFPVAQEGDTVWVEGYEFLLVGELWVYNEKYNDPETNEIVAGYPPTEDGA